MDAPRREIGRIIESLFINVKWKINSHSVILLSDLGVARLKKSGAHAPSDYEGGLLFDFSESGRTRRLCRLDLAKLRTKPS
jgi:hypothetical protein